jgi:hypothetical protein
LFNSLEYGALCGVPGSGGAGSWERKVAETLICKARRNRVSLKSCSGAIHGCEVLVVVPGVSVV